MKQIISIALTIVALAHSSFGSDAVPKPCCSTNKLEAAENKAQFSDTSLYNFDAAWTNDRGERARLAQFRGKPVFLTMFFARCAYACPLLVNDAKRIQAALSPEGRSKVQFVFVSFDSENDTVEALAEFRKRHRLGDEFHLLRGSPDDVLELALLLDVKFVKEQNGQFAHSNVSTLLSPTGEIAFQHKGLSRPVEPAVQAVVAQLAKP